MERQILVDTGRIYLTVNESGENISFNPNDPSLALNFAGLEDAMMAKQAEIESEIKRIEKITDIRARKIAEAELTLEFCKWCEMEIDKVFGEGTCRKAFGGDYVPEAYAELIGAISPYITSGRQEFLKKFRKPTRKPAKK